MITNGERDKQRQKKMLKKAKGAKIRRQKQKKAQGEKMRSKKKTQRNFTRR